MGKISKGIPVRTVGMDLGDRFSRVMVLDADGEVIEESRVATKESALRQRFAGCPRMRIALETGRHSPWVSRVLEDCGHEIVVANSRKLRQTHKETRRGKVA